jgi:hypothetical protein
MLLIGPPDNDAPGGRAMLSRINRAILADLYGDRLRHFPLARSRRPSLAETARGWIDGVDADSIGRLCALIADAEINSVFLDGSNLGAAARAIRRRHPSVRIITFLHNVETRFFLGALKARPGPRALAVLLANHRAERAVVRASDLLLCLSAEDSRMLRRLHGRAADAITPLAVMDRLPASTPTQHSDDRRFALFVGGGFYANLDAVRWFAREVAPHVAIETRVIGRGMEALAAEFASHPTIRIVGAVDDLVPWYRDAHVVIAPVRDGSGMKTKVAEALMFGKRTIGTPQAFAGYDAAVAAAGWLCRDAAAFAQALNEAASQPLPAFDPAARALYERLYSLEAARGRMAAALGIATSA